MALLYTLEEAAGILGISPGELRAKAEAREVPAIFLSGSWRLRSAVVNELAQRRAGIPPSSNAPIPLPPPAAGATTPAPPAPAAPPVATAPPPSQPFAPLAQAGPVAPTEAVPSAAARATVPITPAHEPVPPIPAPSIPAAFAAPPPQPVAPHVHGPAVADAAPESAPRAHLDHEEFERFMQSFPVVAAAPSAGGASGEPAPGGEAIAQPPSTVVDLSILELPEFGDGPPADGDGQTTVVDTEHTPAEPAQDEGPGLPSERGPEPPLVVTCPNLACRTPGAVPPGGLKRPMRCKACGTDFYWDATSQSFVIGLHPLAFSAVVLGDKSDKAGTTATVTASYAYRPPLRHRLRAWGAVGVAVLIVAVVGFAISSRIGWRSDAPNQVQDRALQVGKAFCRNEPSVIKRLVEPDSWSEAQQWFENARPAGWPASDAGAVIEARVKYARVRARLGVCELDIWPSPDGEGIALQTFWLVSGDGEWRLDGKKTLKAKPSPLGVHKVSAPAPPPAAAGRGKSVPRGGRSGKAAPAPPPKPTFETP